MQTEALHRQTSQLVQENVRLDRHGRTSANPQPTKMALISVQLRERTHKNMSYMLLWGSSCTNHQQYMNPQEYILALTSN